MSAHPCEHKSFTRFYDGKTRHEREENLMEQWSSQMRRKVEDSDSYINRASDFMVAAKKYNKGHTQQASLEENITSVMAMACTSLSLVDCHKSRKLISSLVLCIVSILK